MQFIPQDDAEGDLDDIAEDVDIHGEDAPMLQQGAAMRFVAAQHEGCPQDQDSAACGGQQEAGMPAHSQQTVKANQEDDGRHRNL